MALYSRRAGQKQIALKRAGSRRPTPHEVMTERATNKSRHGCGGNELVMRDFRRHAHAAVAGGFHAHDFALATNLHVAAGNVLRQGDYKLNSLARFKVRFG